MKSQSGSGKADACGRATGELESALSRAGAARVVRLLLANLDHFRARFILLSVIGFLDGAVTFFVPVLLAEYTKSDLTRDRLVQLIPLLALLYFASHCLQWVLRKFGEAFGPEYALHLRVKYFRALESLPLPAITSRHSGYMLSIVGAVVGGLGALTNDVFWAVARSASNLSLFFYFTARESVGIAVVNFFILIAFVALSMKFSRRMIPIASALNDQSASLMGTYADFGANLLTVKRLGVQNFAEAKLQSASQRTIERIRQFQGFHALRWFSLHNVFSLALLATISFLLHQISHGRVSSAVLILFVAAFTSVRMNAERLSENFKAVLELDAYAQKLGELLDEVPEQSIGKKLDELGEIKLREVSFHHPGSSVTISIPELRLKRGEKIAVVGESGQGKTTILHLIANFYQPLSGERSVNGVPYGEVNAESFQTLVAMVSQEGELFNLTVRENLLLGANVPESELLQLLEELALREWFDSLEHGFDQVIGEKGITVSQGQKQRINLLRGYLQNRELYLLDEPTSQLDEKTEVQVCDFIRRRLTDKTIVLVTHREALLHLCNRRLRVAGNRLERVSE